MELTFEHSEDDELHYLRAFTQDEPNQLGLISWSKNYRGVIYEIFTRTEYQGHGIATALYREAETGKYGIPIRMTPFNSTESCRAWCIGLNTGVPRGEWDMQAETYWERFDRAIAEGEWG